MGLLMQPNAKYDPVFKATTDVLFLFATWIWEARAPLNELQVAWQHMHDQMSRAEIWAKVKGPLAAVWMSLRRIGWSMTSAHEIVTDSSTFFSLLQVAPRDFRDLPEQGIHRWQLRKTHEHIPEPQDEQIWLK
eukprot:7249750-Pyramimonas_sp.AAC.1